MGLLDTNKAKARKTLSTKRRDCQTYDDAYAYFQYNVKQWAKYEDKSEIPIFEEADGEICLSLSLHQMPLYWGVEKTGGETVIKRYDTDKKALVEKDRIDNIKGQPLYPCGTHEDGWELIQALARTEDADFKQILTRAAAAMVGIEAELDDINEYAEVLYSENSDAVSTFGAWEDKDDAGQRFSAKKQQKKSQYKQTARRRLGYARATDKGTKQV